MSSTLLTPATVEDTVTVADGRRNGRALRDAPGPGTQLGRYMVLTAIGSGGAGVVVKAYDPKLQREVALKQLRSDVLDEHSRARLLREAQAMAQLAHPNVVAIYDVEALDSTVLLVMEYVPGQNLRAWWREAQPAWREVLGAYVQAGRGLAAAHEVGLVHRDFKPDNVLMGHDGRVRVTDFGLALAVDPSALPSSEGLAALSEDNLRLRMTEDGVIMGTPVYMAPEQHAGQDVGAAADQYGFCVALWEALLGTRPFGGKYRQVVDAKQAGPPPWPRDAVVPRRIGEALIRGMATEPAARWPSMKALLEALDQDRSQTRLRWIAGAAVGVATLATAGAVVGWADREPPKCQGAARYLEGIWDEPRADQVEHALLATGAGYAEKTYTRVREGLDRYAEGWVQMHTQACEATAVMGEQSAAVLDLRMACLERRRAVLDATIEVLQDADARVAERAQHLVGELPPLGRCADVEALQAAVPPPEDPAVAVEVERARRELDRAWTHGGVGQQERGLAILDTLPETALEYPPLRAEAALIRGFLVLDLSRYEEARALLGEAYPIALRVGHRRVATELLSSLTFVVGARLMEEGEAHWLGTTAMALAEEIGDDALLALVRSDIAGVLEAHAHYDRAAEQFEHVVELLRRLHGDLDLSLADALGNLALVERQRGDLARSQQLFEQALGIQRTLHGDEHPAVARTTQALGNLLHMRGDYEASVRQLESALAMHRRLYGPEHPTTARTLGSLGTSFSALSRHAEAERNLRAAYEILQRESDSGSQELADTITNLAISIEAQGRYEEALPLHRQALAQLEQALGPEHPRTATSMNNVAGVLLAMHREAEALPMFERGLATTIATVGAEHPHAAILELNAGNALRGLGRYEDAETRLRRALSVFTATFGDDHTLVGLTRVALGRSVWGREGDRSEVLQHLERGLELAQQQRAPSADRAEAALALAEVLWEDPSQRSRARALAEDARDWFSVSGPGHAADRDAVVTWLQDHPPV